MEGAQKLVSGANMLNESFPRFALDASWHWASQSVARVRCPSERWACMHLWTASVSPYWKGIERGPKVPLLTIATDIWSGPVVPGWEQPLPCNASTRCGGWLPAHHRKRLPGVSHRISPYRLLIKGDTGLGQLESFLVCFQCMMAASVGWTPNPLRTAVLGSGKPSIKMNDIVRNGKQYHLISKGCEHLWDLKSTQQGFSNQMWG